MRNLALACGLVLLVGACGDDGGNTPGDGGSDALLIDAPSSAPVLTGFIGTPAVVTPGVPTSITWQWAYLAEPTIPDPTCSINNGVGAVTRGQATDVTLTASTSFTLSCTNSGGTATRQVLIMITPAAPSITNFTATPATLTSGAATNVTWNWTYATPPSPTPTCTIEHGIGTVTPGAATSVTQATGRTYRLRCTNAQGTSTALATVGVDECAANTDDCNPNATCTDTPESFTCTCAAGFTGNGDTCSALQACFTTAPCDPNATCASTTGGPACVCNPGYVGNGAIGGCQRQRVAFVTSTTGTGNLSTWVGAVGVGVAAADSICAAQATTAGLTGTFVAWMSDSTSDAYCRVHGLTGKKAQNCNQASLPVGAGPWVRPPFGATAAAPFAPTIDRLLAPTHVVYQPAATTATGTEVAISDRVYTATDDGGAFLAPGCNDWTSNISSVTGSFGEAHGGGTSWTDTGATDQSCNLTGRLRCVETGAGGPALPSRHPTAKKVFVTSVSGTGNLSTWADAGGLSGLLAADAVCQARARFAGYANSQNFKAWLSSSTSASSRIVTNGPWVRPDGVSVATTESDLEDGSLRSSIHLTETGAYLSGNADLGSVWTGTSQFGSATFTNCSTWSSTASTGTTGRHDLLDLRWTTTASNACTADQRLICLED